MRIPPWACATPAAPREAEGGDVHPPLNYLHTLTIAMTDAMSLSAVDTLCGIVPMFHANSWGLPWVANMLGMKQVYPHRFMDPARLAKLMSDEGVTISAGVPTIWQGLKAAYEANPAGFDFSNLERVTCGARRRPFP